MHRSAATRIACALLLAAYIGAHPLMVCAVRCLLDHHGSAMAQSEMEGMLLMPCQGGQVHGNIAVPVAPLTPAVPASRTLAAVAAQAGPAARFAEPTAFVPTATTHPDTPPPRV